MINESTIERVLARLESGRDDFAVEIQDFAESQPYLMSYLTNEETEAFTEQEREFLLFGALVIYQSVTDQLVEPGVADVAQISAAEEANYALLQGAKGNFRDRLTPFFEQSPQEDLLAFVEDMLVADEEDNISKEGREPLFITLKTVVDVLT
jgi:hypothetical protein